MGAVIRADEPFVPHDMVPPIKADRVERCSHELLQPARPAGGQNKGEPAPES